MNTFHRFLGIAIGIVLCAGAVSLAQEEPDLQAIAAKIQTNQMALRTYSWKSRVAVSIDGEQKKLDMFQLRYDMDGQLQKTPIGGESDAKKVRGPVRKKVTKSKKKEAAEFANDLKALLAKYTEPEALQKTIASAFARTEGNVFKLQTQDVVVQGDSILIEVIPATEQPVSILVKSMLEGSPVVLNVMFQKLADGTKLCRQIDHRHPIRQEEAASGDRELRPHQAGRISGSLPGTQRQDSGASGGGEASRAQFRGSQVNCI